ncbi:hypothetical protein nbrc107696_15030 [Gordonia spumicola]|uniref:Uncharacterized protein n=1 Tax=Gordonia spumicola TaxID=589161 RepID=A0A7I9V6Y3_9ACTN|nr:hypothetical protein nbrc107696_15030 [Gordonia spumicola]
MAVTSANTSSPCANTAGCVANPWKKLGDDVSPRGVNAGASANPTPASSAVDVPLNERLMGSL